LNFPYFWVAEKKERKKSTLCQLRFNKSSQPFSFLQDARRKQKIKPESQQKFTDTRTIMYCNEPNYYVWKRFNVIKQAATKKDPLRLN
jgi:hypothetical protein